jgi:hypothetical protein
MFILSEEILLKKLEMFYYIHNFLYLHTTALTLNITEDLYIISLTFYIS